MDSYNGGASLTSSRSMSSGLPSGVRNWPPRDFRSGTMTMKKLLSREMGCLRVEECLRHLTRFSLLESLAFEFLTLFLFCFGVTPGSALKD